MRQIQTFEASRHPCVLFGYPWTAPEEPVSVFEGQCRVLGLTDGAREGWK